MARAAPPQRPQQTVSIGPNQRIQEVIDASPPGSTFNFSAGTWREQEFLARSNDQFIGDPGGKTILSGARILTDWQRDGTNWRHPGLPPPLIDAKPIFAGSMANHRNDLFLDGHLLERVATLDQVEAGRWTFDANGNAVVMGNDPNGHTVEYTVVANQTWDNGATNCLWKDITVERYGTEAQNGAHHGMRQWTYTNCTFQFMHGAGINIGAGTVISGGKYVDNGQSGINGYAANNARIENAEIARNGFIGYDQDWDGGGVKICGSDGVVFSGNYCHHNRDQGLWLDIDCQNCTYENNKVEDNTGCGIMYEISYGGTKILNNKCARNGGIGGYGGGSIYISNSQGVEVSGNQIEVKPGNKAIGGGISIINDTRGSGNQGLYEARNIHVHDNQITHEADTAQNGYWMYQQITSPAIVFDRNVYKVVDLNAKHWRVVDQDVNWSELQAAGHEQNGTLQQLGDSGGGQPPDPGGGQPPDPVQPPDPITLDPGTYRIQPGTTIVV